MIDFSVYEKLPEAFYLNDDVVSVARQLLGKYLFTNIDGKITVGKIVETEAYNGRNDRACHAFHKKTERNKTMFESGGKAYVYLCYGMHHLFNVVTNVEEQADAVLIRAVEPVYGLEVMQERRGLKIKYQKLTAGPGTLSQALGIKTKWNGTDLTGEEIWIAKGPAAPFEIETDVRIGVDYAGEDALLPWRFFIQGNSFVSVPKKKSPSD